MRCSSLLHELANAATTSLGQFSKGSIRLAFGLYVYPCLILAVSAALLASPSLLKVS